MDAPVQPDSPASYETQDVHAVAQAKGCVVVTPCDAELFVDIDSEAAFDVFKRNFARLQKIETSASWRASPSPSGTAGRQHVIVTLARTVDALERILLQALLGSDQEHEMLSVLAAKAGKPNPTVFFERGAR